MWPLGIVMNSPPFDYDPSLRQSNVERLIFFGLVSGGASGERRAILPQGFPKREVYVCEGKR